MKPVTLASPKTRRCIRCQKRKPIARFSRNANGRARFSCGCCCAYRDHLSAQGIELPDSDYVYLARVRCQRCNRRVRIESAVDISAKKLRKPEDVYCEPCERIKDVPMERFVIKGTGGGKSDRVLCTYYKKKYGIHISPGDIGAMKKVRCQKCGRKTLPRDSINIETGAIAEPNKVSCKLCSYDPAHGGHVRGGTSYERRYPKRH
jgi:hypothetical protein